MPAPPEPAAQPAPAAPPPTSKSHGSRNRILGSLAAAGALVLKFAAKLKALLLILPKLKLLTTSGSMLVSIAAYSLIWGWRFAIGFVLLLFIHEIGHVIQLRREGVAASAPVFIPFLGAAIWAKSLGGNALAEARVGLAGPILGSVAAAALIPVAHATGNQLFRALAFIGLFLNLFNLLPVLPLDGGRAMAAMAPWMWIVGFGAMVGAAILFPNPIILLILLFAGIETWRRWRMRREGGPEQQAYYRVKPVHRLMVAGVYIGLVVLLAFGVWGTHLPATLGARPTVAA
ncbi:MAG: site-2 protease family protein [Solirubrobacteraceae bacterium]